MWRGGYTKDKGCSKIYVSQKPIQNTENLICKYPKNQIFEFSDTRNSDIPVFRFRFGY